MILRRGTVLLIFAALFSMAALSVAEEGGSYWMYIGTYTQGTSRGIYVSRFDVSQGTLTEARLVAETRNPSFLATHPSQPWLFAVGEIYEGQGPRAGAVMAYHLDSKSGSLEFLNQQPSGGVGPCHLAVDPAGRYVVVANYGSGSVATLPIAQDGRLGPPACVVKQEGRSVHPNRQTAPHAHQVLFNPSGKLVLVPDLGLDKVLLLTLEANTGKLVPAEPGYVSVPPGSGPRHAAFSVNGDYLYVLNELTATVSIFRCAGGVASELLDTVSALPSSFSGQNTAAEIAVHPSGRFVYTSNRGHDSIAVFEVTDGGRRLRLKGTVPTKGRNPRFIGLDPTGQYLLAANQDSDSIVVFRLNQETGEPVPTSQTLKVGSPVCLVFQTVSK